MQSFVRIVLIAAIVVFLALAVYYWVTPANALAHFMPGYDGSSTDTHTKHALAAVLIAAGCGVRLWFMTGKKDVPEGPSEPTE